MQHQKITVTAPTRIDLAGGTIDLWPIHFLVPQAATLNFAIDLNATTEISINDNNQYYITSADQQIEIRGDWDTVIRSSQLPLITYLMEALWDKSRPGLTIKTSAKSPAGAGLGGSSCLGITIARALWHLREQLGPFPAFDEHRLVRTVQDCEARIIRIPTGCQDYWGAVRGGVNSIFFHYGQTEVQTLPLKKLPALKEQLLVCFSGKSRASAKNNWEIFKRAVEGEKKVMEAFTEIGRLATLAIKEIQNGNLAGALKISESEWQIRTTLWDDIETHETKAIAAAAKQAGAQFTRVCGAGGGGVMAIFAPPEKHAAVRVAAESAGGKILPAIPTDKGVTIN